MTLVAVWKLIRRGWGKDWETSLEALAKNTGEGRWEPKVKEAIEMEGGMDLRKM